VLSGRKRKPTLRVHHLNCATMCPPAGRLVHGTGSLFAAGHMVCHCLLIESPDGLVLVDTGLGLETLRAPASILGQGFLQIARPRLDAGETAKRQVEAMGFDPADVRHIVLTHMDLDHAGGIADFPAAAVHVLATEHEAAMAVANFKDGQRYNPALWSHQPNWILHEVRGEAWQGFDAVQAIGPGVLLVPLAGHTRGHCGVAVETSTGWLLHAGDAYFAHGEVHGPHRYCPPGLEIFQSAMQVDATARLANQDRLRQLTNASQGLVRVICSHDRNEFEACQ
jgi:glyoxylase-like metal-dependent hydrolase (beta-lactamase superfamily II)